MKRGEKEIVHFFDAYAKRVNDALSGMDPDVEAAADAFAECFVGAGPAGFVCGKNDTELRKSIPQGYAFYKSIGTVSMDIASKEITYLDHECYLVKIHWISTYFKNKRNVVIQFDNYYLLRVNESIKIFAYITGDEQKVLKDNGLI